MRAKKSLGQYFLTSQKVIEKIIEVAKVKDGDIILEIGPGKGVLTKKLLARAKRVITVEKDAELVSLLNETFHSEVEKGVLEIIKGDILKIDSKDIGLSNRSFKVVANIPYYITGALLKKLLSSEIQPSCMVLLVQKEVAERIAKSKKESILSLSVKAYGSPRYIETVPASYFKPKPKVDSAILSIEGVSKDFFSDMPEKFFFKILKEGFKSKRKFLINNLGNFTQKEDLRHIFQKLSIDENTRAEDIHLRDWKSLAKELNRA